MRHRAPAFTVNSGLPARVVFAVYFMVTQTRVVLDCEESNQIVVAVH